jgi:hypothetical protein
MLGLILDQNYNELLYPIHSGPLAGPAIELMGHSHDPLGKSVGDVFGWITSWFRTNTWFHKYPVPQMSPVAQKPGAITGGLIRVRDPFRDGPDRVGSSITGGLITAPLAGPTIELMGHSHDPLGYVTADDNPLGMSDDLKGHLVVGALAAGALGLFLWKHKTGKKMVRQFKGAVGLGRSRRRRRR